MSDELRERSCEQYSGELAELALGVLTGRERAEALSHVESCPRCAEELEQLSRVADTVVHVAPEMDPPVGFEVRLFESMGVNDVRPRRPRLRRLRASLWVPVGVAAAVVALGLGLGLSLTSTPPPKVTSANLVEHGVTVGHVDFGGTKPWMSITLADSPAQGKVDCLIVTDDGVTHWVGSFDARDGYGAWVAPLHVDPATMRSAEVVSPSGTVIATATLG